MNAFFASWEFTNAMSSPWQTASWTMCLFLVLGTLVALVGAVVRLLSKRAAPSVRYTVSLAVFAVLALMPVGIALWLIKIPPTSAPIRNFNPPAVQTTLDLSQPHIGPPSGWETTAPLTSHAVVEPSRPEGGAMVAFSVEQTVAYLPWLWIAGAPITFALLATGLIGSERLRRGCTPIADGIVVDTCSQLRKSLNITRQVSIALCDRIARPVLVGILRPLILLPPAAITGWSPDELEMVLLHELAHVRRWDNLVNLVQRLVESLLFFHPVVWLVSRQVRRDREQCCDAVVVAHTAKPQAYAELLVSIAAKGSYTPSLATASAMADHPLAARIRRILKLEDEPMLVSRRTLGFTALAAVVIVAVVLWQPTKATIAEEPDATSAKDEVAAEITEPIERAADDAKRIVFFPVVRDTDFIPLLEWEKLTNSKDGATVRWNEDGTTLSIEGTEEQHKQFAKLLASMRERPGSADSSSAALGPLRIAPGDQLLVRVEGEFPDQPIDDAYYVEPAGTLALGPTYGRVAVSGKTLSEAEHAVREHLERILSDVEVQITWAAPKSKETTLLYDGKTFDEWRQMWKTELKTEKRIECIKALAAFGRAGYGKEAVEAILEVAGEYDFGVRENNPKGELKKTVIQFLADRRTNQHGWELLFDRYHDNQEKWRSLVYWVLSNFTDFSRVDDQTRKTLVELAKTDAELRVPVVDVVLRSDMELQDPETVALVRESLRGDQPHAGLLAVLRKRPLTTS